MNQKLIFIALVMLITSGPGFTQTVDNLPKISSIAVHQGQQQQLYAATNKGIYVSNDKGLTWAVSESRGLPATMVSAPTVGNLYAFVVGQGLLILDNKTKQWQLINNQFGSQVLLELSVDPNNPNKLLALNQFGKLITSEDSGKSWHSIRGTYQTASEAEARGQSLFEKNCQACHGINGVGETYTLQALTDKDYIRAPAMNDSEHAWHHTDEALAKTILEGSPRTERMMAWEKAGLTEQNAQDLIAYIKSLWTQRELDCQGPKHMQCM